MIYCTTRVKSLPLLIGGEELVEWPSRSHLHHQHQALSLAEPQHADDVRVTQLVHDLRLPHHLIFHQLLILTLQHLDGHIRVAPGSSQSFVICYQSGPMLF